MNDIKRPFIHLFETALGKYLYDVNTAQLLKIDTHTYNMLKNQTIDRNDSGVDVLLNQGFLSDKRVMDVAHPYTELMPFVLKANLSHLVMQITQNCNLRCNYCVYSGDYITRGHSEAHMTLDMAKKCIDFFATNSRAEREVSITFYGGEPLLEFKLIKECITYARSIMPNQNVKFGITTNGTLLNSEVVDFMVENEVDITISLDGPKEIHDRGRKFMDSEIGSFDVILENIRGIYNKHPEYYISHVKFNAVVPVEYGFAKSDEFFKSNELFKNAIIGMSTLSDSFRKEKIAVNERFIIEQQYEMFKLFLSLFGRVERRNVSNMLVDYWRHLLQFNQKIRMTERKELPDAWHRAGPCIPGMTRLFASTNGDLYPCEKVSETDCFSRIGNIKDGFDLVKIRELLNLEELTRNECRDCWAYNDCSICARKCIGDRESCRNGILNSCESVKQAVEETLKDYSVLRELGCEFVNAPEDRKRLWAECKSDIQTPVILVCSLTVGAEKVQKNIYNSIVSCIGKKGYKVVAIGKDDLFDDDYDLMKLPLRINGRIKLIELEHQPDVIIIDVPGNCIEISDMYCGDHGLHLTSIVRSIACDEIVLNIEYSPQALGNLDDIRQRVSGLIGNEVDAVNIYPRYLDIELSESGEHLEYVPLSTEFIINKINNEKGVFVADEPGSCEKLCEYVLDKLSATEEFHEIDTFPNRNESIEDILANLFKVAGFPYFEEGRYKGEPLFGANIKMRARDLLAVFGQIEAYFGILFDEEDILDKSFNTFDSIHKCIKNKLESI